MTDRGDGSDAVAVDVVDLIVDRGPVRAVDGISFTVERGSTTVLLGPNGAGKTSTIEHLEGYLPRRSGSVTVLGTDPSLRRSDLKSRVGLMLQAGGIQTAIRPRELLEQYASFFDSAEHPGSLLAQVGLTDRARTPYRKLSGGEQQRLSLALALIGRPELLFLDEPTSGVDLAGRDLIRTLIRTQRDRGTTVVLSTHDMAEAEQLADRVLVMDHAKLVADGTPAELIAAAEGEDIRFSARAGLDTKALGAASGVPVTEVSPGEYRVESAPTPDVVAAVTAWMAEVGEQLGDLRAGRQRLEDVFRRLTEEPRPTDNDPEHADEPGRAERDPSGPLRGGRRR